MVPVPVRFMPLVACLLTAPAFAQDFSTFDGRCDFVEEVLGGPDVHGSWGTYTLGRLALDPDDAVALEQAVGNVERLDNQSVPIGTIALGLYWDHFSEAQRQRMLAAMKSWREVDGHGTENHALMQNAAGYLFTQWFPGETWTTNYLGPMESGPLNARIRDNLMQVGSSLYDKGYVENLSSTYLLLHLYPWMMIRQFAEDEELRNVADAAIHFHLANLAVNNFHGQVISPFNRSVVQQQNTPHVFDAEGRHTLIPQVPFVTWLYWPESTHYSHAEDLTDAIRRYHGHIGFFCAMRESGPPPDVITRLGGGAGTPYSVRSTAADFGNWGTGDPHDNMRTVYRTEDYAVGTGFFRYAPGGFYINYNGFGIQVETEDKFNVIDVGHNYWMSDLDEETRFAKCMNSIFQENVHFENTAIALFDIPEADPWTGLGRADWVANRDGHQDALLQRIDVRFPKSMDVRVHRDDWVFLREGDTFVAIRTLRPYTFDDTTLQSFDLLRSAGARNAVVFELGTASEHGDFAAFQETILANPLSVDWETLTVDYTNSRGRALTASWVAPEYTPPEGEERVLVRGSLRVDGEPEPGLEALEWPLLDSPNVSLRDRVLRIEEGTDRLTVDWSGERPVFTSETLCAEGLTRCGEDCVDLAADALHCGACDAACEAPAHAVGECAERACAWSCEAGWTDCNGEEGDGCEQAGECPDEAEPEPDPEPEGREASGCGCSSVADPRFAVLGLWLLPWVRRRRR